MSLDIRYRLWCVKLLILYYCLYYWLFILCVFLLNLRYFLSFLMMNKVVYIYRAVSIRRWAGTYRCWWCCTATWGWSCCRRTSTNRTSSYSSGRRKETTWCRLDTTRCTDRAEPTNTFRPTRRWCSSETCCRCLRRRYTWNGHTIEMGIQLTSWILLNSTQPATRKWLARFFISSMASTR